MSSYINHATSFSKALLLKRSLVTVISIQLIFQPFIGLAQQYNLEGGGAHAPNSQRPFIDGARNGVPVVNINTPNQKGLSHNTYNHFNVGPEGVVLNNNATNVNTEAAGWIEGNPNIQTGSEASAILNEVVGATRSQLDGYLEVAGKRTDVIVANPNGITCNGCGFVNTDRGVLTTGAPQIDAEGNLQAYRVDRGDIEIQAGSLDGSGQQRIDLLGQAVRFYGKVKSQGGLNVVAGNNDIDHLSGTVTALDQGQAPEVAVDSSALGGMYADRINLVVTGQGAGVNMVGTELIAVDQLNLTADGDIRMAETRLEVEQHNAVVKGGGDIWIERNPETGKGSEWLVEGDIEVIGEGKMTLDGSRLAADKNLIIGNSETQALTMNESELKSLQNIELVAGDIALQNNPKVIRDGETKAAISANSQLNIIADRHLTVTDTTTDSGVAADPGVGSTLLQGGSITLDSSELVSREGLSLQSLSATGTLEVNNGTRLTSGGHIVADAAGRAEVNDSILDGADRVELDATDRLILNVADISSLDEITLAASEISMDNVSIDTSKSFIAKTTDSDGVLAFDQVDINADQNITLSAGSIEGGFNNTTGVDQLSTLIAGGNITINEHRPTSGFDIRWADLDARGGLTANGGSINFKDTTVVTGSDLIVNGGSGDTFDAERTVFSSQGEARITGGAVSITGQSVVVADEGIDISGASLEIDGSSISSKRGGATADSGNLSLHSSAPLTLSATELSADKDISISAPEMTITNLGIAALGSLLLQGIGGIKASTITLEDAMLVAAQGTLKLLVHNISLTGQLDATGNSSMQLWAGDDIEIQTDSLSSTRSRIWAANDVRVDRDGQGGRADLIRNSEGTITAFNGNLTLSATKVENLGRKPTFVKDAINKTWSEIAPSDDQADVLGDNIKLIKPEFVENGQIKPEHREAYLDLMVGMMNGTPLSDEAKALVIDMGLDLNGEIAPAYTVSWVKMAKKAKELGIDNYDAYLKSLLTQSFENIVQEEVRDNNGNIIQPRIVEEIKIVEDDGSINPGYFDQYYALWEAVIAGEAIPASTMDIVQSANKEPDNTFKPSILANMDDVRLATAVGGYEIKYFLRGDKLNDDGVLAQLIAGGNVDIDADTFDNIHANVSAGGDITITADTSVVNKSYGASQVLLEVHKRDCYVCHEGRLQYGDSFGGRIQAGGGVYMNAGNLTSTVEGTDNSVERLTLLLQEANSPRQHLDEVHDQRPEAAHEPEANVADRESEAQEVTQTQRDDAATDKSTSVQVVSDVQASTTSETVISARSHIDPDDPGILEEIDTREVPRSDYNANPKETRSVYTQFSSFLASAFMAGRLGNHKELKNPAGGHGFPNPGSLRDDFANPWGDGWSGPNTAIARADALTQDAWDRRTQRALARNGHWVEQGEFVSKAMETALEYGGLDPAEVAANPELLKGVGAGPDIHQGGALISGKFVDLDIYGNVSLDGAVVAEEALKIVASNDIDSQAELKSDGDLTIAAIDGSYTQRGGGLSADNADISAGKNINLEGTQVRTEDGLILDAGENVNITSRMQSSKGRRGDVNWQSHRNISSTIETGGDIDITSGSDTRIHASQVAAEGRTTVEAGGNVELTAGENYRQYDYSRTKTKKSFFGLKKKKTSTSHFEDELTHTQSELSGAQGLSINSGGDALVKGSSIASREGDINLQAEGNVNFETVENKKRVEHNSRSSSSFLGFKYKSSQSSKKLNITDNQGSISDAMGDTRHTAGGDSRYIDSRIRSGGNINIEAGGNVEMLAAYDTRSESSEQSSSSLGSLLSEEEKKIREQAKADTTLIDAETVTIQAGSGFGAVTLEGTWIQADTVDILAGLLALVSAKDSLYQSHYSDDSGVLTRTIVNAGQIKEQAVAAHIDAPNIMLNGQALLQDGLTPEGLMTRISSENPQLSHAQLQTIQAQLQNEQWHEEIKTLSKMGQIIVQAIVTYIFPGSTVAIDGASAAVNTTVNAALNSLISQFATQVVSGAITGEFNLDLGDMLEGAVKAAAVAGITYNIDVKMGFKKLDSKGNYVDIAVEDLTVIQRVQKTILYATAQTGVYGGSLKDNILNAAIDDLGEEGASYIGDTFAAGSLANVISHLGLGCVLGEAAHGDCGSGATGAALSAAIAPYIARVIDSNSNGLDAKEKEAVKALSQISSAFIAGVAGKDVEVASYTALNEVEHNYLTHYEASLREEAIHKLAACESNPSLAHCTPEGKQVLQDQVAELNRLDAARDSYLFECVQSQSTSSACQSANDHLQASANEWQQLARDNHPTLSHIRMMQEMSETTELGRDFQWYLDDPDGRRQYMETKISIAKGIAYAVTAGGVAILSVELGSMCLANPVACTEIAAEIEAEYATGGALASAAGTVGAKKARQLSDEMRQMAELSKQATKGLPPLTFDDMFAVIPNSGSLTPVVVSKMPKELSFGTSSGVKLTAVPDKTTTVLGSYGKDMQHILSELDYPKTLDFGAKKSGFNVLNAPDSLYKNPDQFWKDYNKPFLDEAIKRGDVFPLATKPTNRFLNRRNPDTGLIERSGFGREYDYLISKGYKYDSATSSMVKP